ncbi:hypothetical protein CERZMDRAFT_115520 [Cercospora zeae-maydis SCOH1-5]|uniref:Uncharacterized protein n=1 Tax=Cercospora zeae-maydis SCOH1-5 TaxID=717836 RepID=A0A6A6F0E4_9PEZI|nr:hypothetical protein CERZMDRAFT_115520 [Cercospora zeae-maydis SCOH1-5]
MCIAKLSEFSCGHVETIFLNGHCYCPLLVGEYDAQDALCPKNCGSPVSPIAFRSMLGVVSDRSQVLDILPWEKHEARSTTQRKQWALRKDSLVSVAAESVLPPPSRIVRTLTVLHSREPSTSAA